MTLKIWPNFIFRPTAKDEFYTFWGYNTTMVGEGLKLVRSQLRQARVKTALRNQVIVINK